MIDIMLSIQQQGTENYDCKTIIGILGGIVAAQALFIVRQFFARIQDLKQRSAMIDAILDSGTKRREAPDV